MAYAAIQLPSAQVASLLDRLGVGHAAGRHGAARRPGLRQRLRASQAPGGVRRSVQKHKCLLEDQGLGDFVSCEHPRPLGGARRSGQKHKCLPKINDLAILFLVSTMTSRSAAQRPNSKARPGVRRPIVTSYSEAIDNSHTRTSMNMSTQDRTACRSHRERPALGRGGGARCTLRTASSSTRCEPPACIAGPAARRARHGPRTWRSMRPPPTPSAPASAPASAASPTSRRSRPNSTRRRWSPGCAASSRPPSRRRRLDELARARQHRARTTCTALFKAHHGLTPKAYAAAHRARRVRERTRRAAAA